jgi:hypothetical protein
VMLPVLSRLLFRSLALTCIESSSGGEKRRMPTRSLWR